LLLKKLSEYYVNFEETKTELGRYEMVSFWIWWNRPKFYLFCFFYRAAVRLNCFEW